MMTFQRCLASHTILQLPGQRLCGDCWSRRCQAFEQMPGLRPFSRGIVTQADAVMRCCAGCLCCRCSQSHRGAEPFRPAPVGTPVVPTGPHINSLQPALVWNPESATPGKVSCPSTLSLCRGINRQNQPADCYLDYMHCLAFASVILRCSVAFRCPLGQCMEMNEIK